MSERHFWSVAAMRTALAKGEISAQELATLFLQRIEALEPHLQAYLTVTPEEAIAQAKAVDEKRARKEPLHPLAGIPIALKDNLCTRGIRTTAASKILYNFVPPYDATVVAHLRESGMVFLGKTNLDEFAMGSSTENSGFQPTRNPWDLERVPGGSSGGSAAAVAAAEAPLALGSDTGGSIRQPAALCGIVGMKPTYGRVSRYGLIAYASSLDQIGPFARTVADCALLLQAISGHDPLDSTCLNLEVPDYVGALTGEIKGLRLGVPKEYFGAGVQPEVAAAVRQAIEVLAGLGATVEECSLPTTDYALAAYYIIAPAECSSNLARFDGVRYGLRSKEWVGHIGLTEKTRDEGFGPEVKQRIVVGTYALSAGYYDAYYRRAQQTRTLIRRDFDRAFERFDALVTPTSPTPAFRIGEKADPLEMKLADVCTIPVNMAGLPGLSVPCGFVNGLPVGLQLIGKPFDETTLLRIAHAYEQATDWHRHHPKILES
ncbi:MAG TPA: Asp-tRNA(Asn)/Glu-tRNA(Gln) amidotransferase subunit GatA [Chthonomonas sp.]|uniref:Asp-tRNA(Asn)/Glu-tRNA(Gln) amidotransferase subunit GatA n=1 Tax=Chthonomonas sp. TaxID=2282153 RepID=UPI002B4B182B|nr:Asp-tRNA(Asn)/Glu-tRNA(Gln) amidotransferase subunit GatA [Chthonomonas sp.]HLI49339.1 Asp-tRNA(Asn)/Glu-tRNA(Gln) amidotransferase subunit GatA [Chthonomonas sp.]